MPLDVVSNEGYHWNELWRSLLGLLKFLLSKSDDLTDLLGINDLANSLVDLLAAALSGGDTFLPGTADYDDLFYKLVQSSGTLETFSATCTYQLSNCSNIRFWKATFAVNDNTP